MRVWPQFLDAAVRGSDAALFPLKLRLPLKPKSSAVSVAEMAAAVSRLRADSKLAKGFGYTVHVERRRSRQMGENDFPAAVTIDSRDDLLRLLEKRGEYARTMRVATAVRHAFPQLEFWLTSRARRLAEYAETVDPLLAVTQVLVTRPWPDVYLRQLPIPVDTKFVERHEKTLIEWLDKLLPAEKIRVDERRFARRYGLRDGEQHLPLRILDATLQDELNLPTDELSVPVRFLTTLPVHSCRAIVVENRTNLFTLPALPRTLALGGVGNAVTQLRDLLWLANTRLVYWGDLDVDGLRILVSLRALFPHVESLFMDIHTLTRYEQLVTSGNGKALDPSPLLSDSENAALQRCSERNERLEQEQIPQRDVDAALRVSVAGVRATARWDGPIPGR
jgi:hypothetical protein